MNESTSDVTRIVRRIAAGDRGAADELLPLVYDELRKLAKARLGRESPGQTLAPTALVHEAYARLVGGNGQPSFDGKGHFFGAAAKAMRRILVENARRKQRVRHGGGRLREELVDPAAPGVDDELLAFDEALTALAAEDEIAAQVVEMRRFAELSHEEVALALGLTVYRARQKWTYARAWLRDALKSS